MKLSPIQIGIIKAIGVVVVKKRELKIKHLGREYNTNQLTGALNGLKKKKLVTESKKGGPGTEMLNLTGLGKTIYEELIKK